MLDITKKMLPVDVAIFSAAVSDFKSKKIENKKIKKSDEIKLELEKTTDILGYVSKHNSLRPKLVIGFAAETGELEKNSKIKLTEKNCDWIIANDVSRSDIGFNSDMNEVTIYSNDKVEKINKNKKSIIAKAIVQKLIKHLN